MTRRGWDDSQQPDSVELARLLDAARAPGSPHEVQGVETPLAMLRAPGPAAPRRFDRAIAAMRAASLATKLAMAAVLAVVLGGTVVAGATGHLPGQHHPRLRPHPGSSSSNHGSTTPERSRSAHPNRSNTPSTSGSASPRTSSPATGTPTTTRSSASPASTSPSSSASVSRRSSAPKSSPSGTRKPKTTR